ncbi:MAG: response regulator [candidate division Zixibacteria bacterium]|nr:response regulator [candidate division Zixibacteria bacterium]
MKVLIVDDSQIMRKIITGVLKKLKVNDTIEAVNGQEAVTKAGENDDIGLILMDWNMPVMNGLDAVKKIRGTGSKVPIVMCTTEAEKERVLEAVKAGTNDYLVKPFNPKDIQNKLGKFLAACTS